MSGDSDKQDEALQRKLDWATGELARGEQAPDVVGAVVARHASAASSSAYVMPARGRPSLLSAALALLGLSVVTWLLLTSHDPEVDEANGSQVLVVSSLAEIAQLPRTAEAVELLRLGDVAVEQLIDQCPQLTMLSVKDSNTLTSAVGHTLRTRLPGLREVRLSGCVNVDDVSVAELIALPSLRKLALDGCRLSEHCFELLRAARQLRHLELGDAPWLTVAMAESLMQTGKHVRARHGDDADFARAVAALHSRYEHRLDQPFYHVVRSLSELEALPQSVEYIEVRKYGDMATKLLAKRSNLRGLSYIRDDHDGFTVESMRLLATMTSLEELDLGNVMKWDGSGMEGLANLTRLRVLDVSSAPVDDAGLRVLPKMLALRDLELVGLRRFGSDGMASIAACRGLTRLSLAGCDQLSDQQLAAVGKLTTLRELVVTSTQFGEQAVAALAPLKNLERLYLGKCVFSNEAAKSLSGMRNLAILELRENPKLGSSGLLELPVSLRELQLSMCTGFDASACTILRDRFPQLAMLGVAGSPWISDAGLAQILDNRAINHLSINSCSQLTTASYDSLRAARHLHRLQAVFAGKLTEQKLAELAEERPDMKIESRVW